MPTMTLGGPTPVTPDLRSALHTAHNDPTWWNRPGGRSLLAFAQENLRPLALKVGADPEDALSHAFEAWSGFTDKTIDGTKDLWAYTRRSVRRALAHEQEAARKVTSTAALRRVGTRDAQFCDDTGALDTLTVDGPDSSTLPEAEELAESARGQNVLNALTHVLVIVGMTSAERSQTVDMLADIAHSEASTRTLLRKTATAGLRICPSLDRHRWNLLSEILLGTPRGKSGVLALAAAGHPAPASEPHIASRLYSLLAQKAAA